MSQADLSRDQRPVRAVLKGKISHVVFFSVKMGHPKTLTQQLPLIFKKYALIKTILQIF